MNLITPDEDFAVDWDACGTWACAFARVWAWVAELELHVLAMAWALELQGVQTFPGWTVEGVARDWVRRNGADVAIADVSGFVTVWKGREAIARRRARS